MIAHVLDDPAFSGGRAEIQRIAVTALELFQELKIPRDHSDARRRLTALGCTRGRRIRPVQAQVLEYAEHHFAEIRRTEVDLGRQRPGFFEYWDDLRELRTRFPRTEVVEVLSFRGLPENPRG